MQKIYFEKWIDLNHQLKELVSLSVDESINYKIESAGIRAVGSLNVKGEYNDLLSFNESIELDILATFDKIIDQRDFNIKVEDFDYFIKNGDVKIRIEVGIHGVVDGDDRFVKDEYLDNSALDEIESLIREDEVEIPVVEDKVIEDVIPIEDKIESINNDVDIEEDNDSKDEEELQEKVYSSKSRPIFKDDEDSIGTYYLYVVKENESYGSVASRYGIDEEVIRDYNQNKVLDTGSILIIPYMP